MQVMDILFTILVSLGAVIGVLGMVLLVGGAAASAAIDHDSAGSAA